MSIIDLQRHAAEATRVEPEAVLNEAGIIDTTICECGLPEVCCDHYCSIDSCDWLVY